MSETNERALTCTSERCWFEEAQPKRWDFGPEHLAEEEKWLLTNQNQTAIKINYQLVLQPNYQDFLSTVLQLTVSSETSESCQLVEQKSLPWLGNNYFVTQVAASSEATLKLQWRNNEPDYLLGRKLNSKAFNYDWLVKIEEVMPSESTPVASPEPTPSATPAASPKPSPTPSPTATPSSTSEVEAKEKLETTQVVEVRVIEEKQEDEIIKSSEQKSLGGQIVPPKVEGQKLEQPEKATASGQITPVAWNSESAQTTAEPMVLGVQTEQQGSWNWWWRGLMLGGCLTVIFLLLLWKKRKKEEEENQNSASCKPVSN